MKRDIYLGLQGDRLVTIKEGRVVVVKRLVGLSCRSRKDLLRTLACVWGGAKVNEGGCKFYIRHPLRKEEGEEINKRFVGVKLPAWLLNGGGDNSPSTQREAGENRRKDTDEVSEQSDDPSDDAEHHGGDGNSGEVDAPAVTSSEEERAGKEEGGSSRPPNPSKAGEGDGEGKGEEGEREGEGEGEGAEGGESGNGSHGEGIRPTDLSTAREACEGAETSDKISNEEQRQKNPLKEQYAPKGEMARGDETYRNGRTSSVVRTEVTEPSAKVGIALKKVLKRLFKGWSSVPSDETGGQASSPRISGSSLIREMSTRRWNTSRVFREELECQPKMILVAADVSGSCSASSGHTVGICQALTKVWPELLFVTHANSDVGSVTKNGKTVSDWEVIPSFKDLVIGHRVLGALLFGDADGFERLHAVLAETVKASGQIIWLDSYRAKYGEVIAGKWTKVYGIGKDSFRGNILGRDYDFKYSGLDPFQYYIGVNNEETAACALRQALRNKK